MEEKKILERPHNWEDIVDKYRENETRKLEEVMEKRGVKDLQQLKEKVGDTLEQLKERSQTDRVELKDRTVKIDPESPIVKEQAKEIKKKTQETFEQIANVAKQYPSLSPKLTHEEITGTKSEQGDADQGD